jgi:branched-chain amino acid aminotransferase
MAQQAAQDRPAPAEPSGRVRYLMLDGELVPYAEARVHVLSTTVKFGAGVFEGFRAYWSEGRQQLFGFRLKDHLRRLETSIRVSRLERPPVIDRAAELLVELMRANELREDLHLRLQVLVVADDGPMPATGPVTVSMAALPMGRYFPGEGRHAAVSSWTRIGDRSMPPRVKAIANYHNSRLALLQARADGYDDAILLTGEGRVAEGPGYNLFLARDGALATPPTTEGILEGVTRDTLIRLARRLGLTVEVRPIDRTELYQADEIFFCGSGAEVMPVLSVDRHPVADGTPGKLTVLLREAYMGVARGEVPDPDGWLTPVYPEG